MHFPGLIGPDVCLLHVPIYRDSHITGAYYTGLVSY